MSFAKTVTVRQCITWGTCLVIPRATPTEIATINSPMVITLDFPSAYKNSLFLQKEVIPYSMTLHLEFRTEQYTIDSPHPFKQLHSIALYGGTMVHLTRVLTAIWTVSSFALLGTMLQFTPLHLPLWD